MVVVVLVNAPPGLRGHPTRWMLEVQPGTYVGNLTSKIRNAVWALLEQRIGDGQVVMVEPSTNEQGWSFRTAGRDRWSPIDYDGLQLIARPRQQNS